MSILEQLPIIENLELQIENEHQRALFNLLCCNLHHFREIVLNNNILFEELTFEYLFECLYNKKPVSL
jgi:hypothetical protein